VTQRGPDDRLAAVAALGDRLRRALYRFVVSNGRPVSRDEAARAVDVTRSAAAFHLDRLVDEGLLVAEFRRLTGRQGPGAGRPSKLYRRAHDEISVNLPPRRYDTAADLLASAVDEATASGTPVELALQRVARERGAALAGAVAGTGPQLAAALAVLDDQGYEPRLEDGGEVVLANCPFHALVEEHRPLVCGMNLAFLEGFSGGVPALGMTARLQPDEHHCCVRLVPVSAPTRRTPS
jgi:predicted ArsR family transcriptional regulator